MEELYADNEFKGYLVNNVVDLKKVAQQLKKAKRFAFDTEGTSVIWYRNRLVGISLSLGKREQTWYVAIGHITDEPQVRIDEAIRVLKPIFEDNEKEIIGHNLKYDLHVLSRYGLWDYRDKWKIMNMKVFDTMIAYWLVDENTENGLKYACRNYGIIDDIKDYDEVVATVPKEVKKAHGLKANQKATMDLVDVRIAGAYACDDAFGTYRLRKYVIDDMKAEGMYERFVKMEMPYLKVLYLKEQRGIKIDVERLKKMGNKVNKEMENLAYDIYSEVGYTFNLNAPAQLAKVIFNDLGFPVLNRTKKGQPSIAGDTIDELLNREYKKKKMRRSQEILKKIDDWRKLAKHKSSFIDGILSLVTEDGVLHPQFKQHGTVTGRLSCTDPNIQQMPRPLDPNDKNPDIRAKYDIRDCFIADDPETQYVSSADYGNLELRIIAHFSEEPTFIEAFKKGEDIHSRTAVTMLGVNIPVENIKKEAPEARQVGKTINFAQSL